MSACHLKPQDSQPSGNGSSTVTELIACEEAEAAAAKALAQINQHLFISTYKTDFGGTVHGNDTNAHAAALSSINQVTPLLQPACWVLKR